MEDDKRSKVLRFPLNGQLITTEMVLKAALEEVTEFPQKTCFLMMLDEEGNIQMWGNNKLTREELCRMYVELQIHVMQEMVGAND